MGKRWVDRGLIAATLLLVGVIAAGALSGISLGRHDPVAASTQSLGEGRTDTGTTDFTTPETFPEDPEIGLARQTATAEVQAIPLHGSPETALLKRCRLSRLGLQVENGQRLVVAYDGPPCQLPRLALTAIVRGPGGKVLARRPALSTRGIPTTLAGDEMFGVPLATGLLRCWSGEPLNLRAQDQGRVVRGTIRCRGQR